MKRETDRFTARSDDGEYEVVICIFQDFIEANALDGSRSVIPARLKEIRTTDGYSCNYIDENTFEVLDASSPNPSPLIVRRVVG